jgi:hypothetical protein
MKHSQKHIFQICCSGIILALAVLFSMLEIGFNPVKFFIYHLRIFDLLIVLLAIPFLKISYGIVVVFLEP